MQNMVSSSFLSEFDEEVQAEQLARQERKPVPGKLMRLYMPQMPDKEGVRKALIRIRTPFDEVQHPLVHEVFNQFCFMCPGEFGFECQICAKLAKKVGVKSREELLRPSNLVKAVYKETTKTRKYWFWQVWYYDAFKDKVEPPDEPGGDFLLAWPRNSATPINAIMLKHKALYIDVDEDQEPISLNDIDLELVQSGESTEKSFVVNEKIRRDKATGQLKPFKFEQRSKLWSPLQMKIGLALSLTDRSSELYVRYQNLYQKYVSEGRIPMPDEEAPEVAAESKPLRFAIEEDEEE